MLKGLILDAAYALQASKSYQAKKLYIYNILENDRNRYKKYIDVAMILLVFISVSVLIRQVKHPVPDALLFFSNYVISIIFFIEYSLRLWVSSSASRVIVEQSEHDTFLSSEVQLSKAFREIFKLKLKYIFSIKALIDLLAILPFFHELRLLRAFILFRMFKLFRYANSFGMLSSVLLTKKFEFITLAIFASIVIFVSSVLIYVMEANNPDSPINTLFDGLYWSIVTISTVGYGDVTPITDAGRVVAMIVIVSGIAVLAFTTSLVVSAFNEKLDEIKEVKSISDIKNLHGYYIICGYEKIAKELAKKLKKSPHKTIVLDSDIARVREAKQDGFLAMNYSPGSVESYSKLNIDIKKEVKAILCLREDDVENVYTALTVRSMDSDVFILSLLIKDINRKKLEFAGVDHIVYPQELVGLITKELVGKPAAFEVIHQFRSEYTNVDIQEIALTERMVEHYPNVGVLKNRKYKVIILGVFKGDSSHFYFNPVDSTLLENGDYLLCVGYGVFIREFEKSLYKRAEHG